MTQAGAVLVTGATGFLGSAVARELSARGRHLIGLSRDPSAPRRSRRYRISELRPLSQLDQAGALAGIDAVIHTATSYGRQGESEAEVEQANVALGMRVTEAALTAGTSLFVNTDTLLPAETSPYAASKARFRDWARAHVGGSPLCFVNLRIEQMYGPGDDESKFPSFVIAHCMRNAEEIKLSPGAQERDFVHVDDVVAAIALFVLDRPALGAGFHEFEIGCGVPVSLRSFAESVRELSGARTRLAFGALPYRPNEVMRCVANPSALRALGWRCRHDLQSGLRATLAAERAAS